MVVGRNLPGGVVTPDLQPTPILGPPSITPTPGGFEEGITTRKISSEELMGQAYLASYCPAKSALRAWRMAGFWHKAAIICRSGTLEYTRAELELDGAGLERVYRPPENLEPQISRFCRRLPGDGRAPTVFSFPTNFAYTAKGHCQNARVGSHDSDGNLNVLADLFVRDDALIGKIRRGLRALPERQPMQTLTGKSFKQL